MAAFYGKGTGNGGFLIEDVLGAGLPHQVERPIKTGELPCTLFWLFFQSTLWGLLSCCLLATLCSCVSMPAFGFLEPFGVMTLVITLRTSDENLMGKLRYL